MIPGSQPSRPKLPQQSPQTTFAHQQRRATNTTSYSSATAQPTMRPKSQIEAMPPSKFDSAVRHPVFFTQNLRKPPFPIPQIATEGWSPVANGYILEQQKAMNGDMRNKL